MILLARSDSRKTQDLEFKSKRATKKEQEERKRERERKGENEGKVASEKL